MKYVQELDDSGLYAGEKMLLLDTVALSLLPNDSEENHAILYRTTNRKFQTFQESNLTSEPEHVFSAQLSEIITRLDLLGFSLASIKDEYETSSDVWHEKWGYPQIPKIPFNDLLSIVIDNPFSDLFRIELPGRVVWSELGSDKIKVSSRFDSLALDSWFDILNGWPNLIRDTHLTCMTRTPFALIRRHLCVYSLLKLVSENERNRSLEVVWRYRKNLSSSVNYDDFQSGLEKGEVILIATEGSSDAFILKTAFEMLRPDVADFFRFFDMEGPHPASGTSGLVKLAEALCQINLGSCVLFLFDNDAEGCEANNKLLLQKLPAEIDTMTLPDLTEFQNFPTIGPDGATYSNINGRAAAIECYLDLRIEGYPEAFVTWRNYKDGINAYHGVLMHKESYLQRFKEAMKGKRPKDEYDTSKLSKLINAIIIRCIGMVTKSGG